MNRGKPRLLLISGVPGLAAAFAQDRLTLSVASDLPAAKAQLDAAPFDALLVQVGEVAAVSADLAWLGAHRSDTPVLAFGPASLELERAALAAGAVEYLSWPATAQALALALDSTLARSVSATLESPLLTPDASLLGSSPHMLAVKETLSRVAHGQATVLVRGETGTGKELVARALHAGSARHRGPFIKVHAAALPDTLLESELFGYERGAFTGATTRKAGRVELAEGGTLFFDEIGDVSPVMQTKLLRLIQDREYERLGGTRTQRADVRFVTATHRDLEHMVSAGTFREDLLYRLKVVTVWLPPLRARRKDVALIASHYFEHFARVNGKPWLTVDEAALRVLQAQRWPGNVRELVNFVERVVVLAQGRSISADEVQSNLQEQTAFLTQATSQEVPPPALSAGSMEPEAASPGPPSAARSSHESSAVRPLREELRRTEYRALIKALDHAKGNRALAARMLGVSRRTLYTKLEEHGIE